VREVDVWKARALEMELWLRDTKGGTTRESFSFFAFSYYFHVSHELVLVEVPYMIVRSPFTLWVSQVISPIGKLFVPTGLG
jgi:hypothetical protein